MAITIPNALRYTLLVLAVLYMAIAAVVMFGAFAQIWMLTNVDQAWSWFGWAFDRAAFGLLLTAVFAASRPARTT